MKDLHALAAQAALPRGSWPPAPIEKRNAALLTMARELEAEKATIFAANELDLARR